MKASSMTDKEKRRLVTEAIRKLDGPLKKITKDLNASIGVIGDDDDLTITLTLYPREAS